MAKKSFLAALVYFFSALSANATNNFSTNATFALSIDFVDAITLSVDDVTIENAVGGDIIDQDVSMIAIKDSQRSATCSTTALILTSSGEANITAITASVDNSCSTLSLDGTLPADAANGKTYVGTITITYSYDVTTLT